LHRALAVVYISIQYPHLLYCWSRIYLHNYPGPGKTHRISCCKYIGEGQNRPSLHR